MSELESEHFGTRRRPAPPTPLKRFLPIGIVDVLRRLLQRAFRPLDAAGLHVLPKHYYSPVPDYSWLQDNPDAWRRPAYLPGVRWDLESQVQWLKQTCHPPPYVKEIEAPGWEEAAQGRLLGEGFGPTDGRVLHCFIRTERPRQIIEVGGGESTGIMLAAARLNELEGADRVAMMTIEPYPSQPLLSLEGVEVVARPVQLVPLDVFERLGPGDLLFVDSSHTVKTGSEVVRICLEVIPALPPGVFVHLHDIFLPYLYHRSFGRDFYDMQETALVVALLSGNSNLDVLASCGLMHYVRSDNLRQLFPSYRPRRHTAGIEDPEDETGDALSSLYLVTR